MVGPMSNYDNPPQLVDAVDYRFGPRKITTNPLSALEPLVDITAVHNYAIEFTQTTPRELPRLGRTPGRLLQVVTTGSR